MHISDGTENAVVMCVDQGYLPFALFMAEQLDRFENSRNFDICLISDDVLSIPQEFSSLGIRVFALIPTLSPPRKRGPTFTPTQLDPRLRGDDTKNAHHPNPTQGRTLPRAGAATSDVGALSLNPSHRSSGEQRRKSALPGGGRARPGGLTPLIPGYGKEGLVLHLPIKISILGNLLNCVSFFRRSIKP